MMLSPIISRALSTSAQRSAIQKVTVIGSGIMGSGIAQVAAQSGHKVILVDQNEALLNKAKGGISTTAGRMAKKAGYSEEDIPLKVSEMMSNLSFSTDPLAASKEADLVIEAIVENLQIKKDLFKALDKAAPSSTIFASNTSGLVIGEIAEAVERKDKFAGLHFFNPVTMMKLLEIVSTPEVSKEVVQELEAFGKSIGKVSINCKDNIGFVVNRLLIPYLFEAIKMAERGNATCKDIDIGMKLGCGYPMGPFQLLDFGGLDTFQRVIGEWHKKYPENSLYFPSPMLDKMVAEGKFGMKSGEGFYKYQKK